LIKGLKLFRCPKELAEVESLRIVSVWLPFFHLFVAEKEEEEDDDDDDDESLSFC
jgi:hypothetical protein